MGDVQSEVTGYESMSHLLANSLTSLEPEFIYRFHQEWLLRDVGLQGHAELRRIGPRRIVYVVQRVDETKERAEVVGLVALF